MSRKVLNLNVQASPSGVIAALFSDDAVGECHVEFPCVFVTRERGGLDEFFDERFFLALVAIAVEQRNKVSNNESDPQNCRRAAVVNNQRQHLLSQLGFRNQSTNRAKVKQCWKSERFLSAKQKGCRL